MLNLKSLRFAFLLFSFTSFSQQLLINEISQGTAAKEYVEFIVAGTPTCQTPVPCLDMRGIVIDDNNGYFASGSGTGIAVGAVRFANIPFWSCIPQGTLIVIYNEMDVNPALPPNDVSMTDGNCRLVLPTNSNLLEGQSDSPTPTNSTYPPSGNWIAGNGNWNQLGMSNSNDSFQIRTSISSATPSHSVSWGNNTNNTQITFASASGNVFSMTNNVSNDAFLQGNWTQGAVTVDETPGAPNSSANASWIGSMNPQCGTSNTITLTMSSTQTGCGTPCTGTANVSISGGVSPYTILWSNGGTTSTISNLCAGTYTVDVTDAGGCTATNQVVVSQSSNTMTLNLTSNDETCSSDCDGSITSTVSGGASPYTYAWDNGASTQNISSLCPNTYTLTVSDQNGCSSTASATVGAGGMVYDPTILTTGPFSTDDSPVQFVAATSGGTWTASCGTCITSGGIFSPQSVVAGTYQICYDIGTGACASNDCVSILVTEGCVAQYTSLDTTACPGEIINANGQQYDQAGTYAVTFTDLNGCDSTHTVVLDYFTLTPQSQSYEECNGDSVFVNNNWYNQNTVLTENIIDANGCPTINTISIQFEECPSDDFHVFIPNVFTPNGDMVNDLFTISIEGGTLDTGYIFNRWGTIIFEFNANKLSWNGQTMEGEEVQDGVYIYLVKVSSFEGESHQYHGFVTIIR